tara:strand:+ start:1787 stop:2626 length:840 start_codon:yes stop_codon:yes gene_type:complete
MIKEDNNKFVWLEKFESFLIEGEDSKRFINGITTTNMLIDRKIVQTCWLNPKGILRALLEIHFYEENLLLIVLEGNISEIRDFLEDMIFPSDKVSIVNNPQICRIQEVRNNKSWREFQPELIKEKDLDSYLKKKNINIIEPMNLEKWKIIQAIPRINKEIDGNNNPLELGLYDLVDFNKGCYLGQEIMARLNKISSLKQEIRIWSAPFINKGKLKDNNIYLNKDEKKVAGSITSFLTINSKQVLGLSMIKKSYLNDNESFFNEDLGVLKIQKSIGSVFI